MTLEELCSTLNDQMASRASEEERMSAAVQALCQIYKVKPGEVAFFSYSPESKSLAFRWPLRLAKSGTIPLSSADALISRTVQEKKGFINNHFASARHVAIFEQIRTDPDASEAPKPIQKIMSVPLWKGEEIIGVLQVCRKGADQQLAGSDFGKGELVALTELARVCGSHL